MEPEESETLQRKYFYFFMEAARFTRTRKDMDSYWCLGMSIRRICLVLATYLAFLDYFVSDYAGTFSSYFLGGLSASGFF